MSIKPRQARLQSGFTLTELLVAVVVLLVVILAVGRIFGTSSQVVKSGEANASVLQEITALEQQMRKDFSRISEEGFLVINCLAVRNNVNGNDAPLLDPRQDPAAWLRCDQVAFLTDKLAVSQVASSFESYNEVPQNTNANWDNRQVEPDHSENTIGAAPSPQSTMSCVYYGHGLQFPYLAPSVGEKVVPFDDEGLLQPWFRPDPTDSGSRISLERWPDGGNVSGSHNGSQPSANNWALARQEVLVADDQDGDPDYYLSPSNMPGDRGRNSAAFLFDTDVATSRVDVVATDLGRIRDSIRAGGRGVADALFFYRPRAEKNPLTRERSDVMTTLSTLMGNCSSFIVDWTWADGTGADSSLGTAFGGVGYNGGVVPVVQQIGQQPNLVEEISQPVPWFGLDVGVPQGELDQYRDVTTATAAISGGGNFHQKRVRFRPPVAYDASDQGLGSLGDNIPFGVNTGVAAGSSEPRAILNVEGAAPVVDGLDVGSPWDGNVLRYSVVFALNGDEPFIVDGEGNPLKLSSLPDGGVGGLWPMYRSDYTPWPSALRVTAVVHDSKDVIENGRVVQFTVPLPRSVQDLPE